MPDNEGAAGLPAGGVGIDADPGPLYRAEIDPGMGQQAEQRARLERERLAKLKRQRAVIAIVILWAVLR